MTLSNLRSWLEQLADCHALVPAEQVLARLPDSDGAEPAPTSEHLADLTVDEVAEAMDRTPACVRAWLRAEDLAGYKLQGREWRIRREDLRAFQDRQRTPAPAERRPRHDGELSDWRST